MMVNTPNRGYPLPDEANDIDAEFWTLALTTLPKIDLDMQSLFGALGQKADQNHGHEIADIAGLATALAAKMSAGQTFSLADLTDVVGVNEAAIGYILAKVGDQQWVAMTALAALGAHTHPITDVLGLPEIVTKVNAIGTMANRNITVSTSAPSGGADGDIWFQVDP